MHKIDTDYTQELPWRADYVGNTNMSYGGRRIDRIQTGGGRDSSACIAGSRSIMAGGFANGELTPLKPTERGELNGLEQDYVNSDWGVFLEGEGEQLVLDVIRDDESFEDHIIIIHCNALRRGDLSVTRIPKMMKHHSSYGFDIIPVNNLDELLDRKIIPAGTRLAHTRATMPTGGYGHGREANCVFISSFSTNEDTCCVLDTVLDDFTSVGMEEFSIPVNNENLPLNIHGESDVYRGVPRVGAILEDGIVMATRDRRRDAYLSHRTKKSLQSPRYPFDKVYSCKRGGEVVSVEVIKATTAKVMNKYIPTAINQYLDNIAAKYQSRHHTVLELDKKYRREFKDSYKPSPSYNILITEAIKRLFGPKLKPYYRNIGKVKEVHGTIEDNIITGYLIRIKVRSIIKPHLGHKFNDSFGAKYTISEIRDSNRMFTDQWGRTAEFATNGVANINRGIWGRICAQYRGDSRFHLLRTTRERFADEGFEAAKEHYLNGIKVLSDKSSWELSQLNQHVLDQHIKYIIENAPFIQVTDEVGDESLTVHGTIKVRDSIYKPPRGKLKFTDWRGRECETVNDVRIGPMYISINEKIGSDYSATNIPLRQISGINRKLTSSDKKLVQISETASRATGEKEFVMFNDSLPEDEARIVLREGTSQASVNESFKRFSDGEFVPDIDVTKGDARGMEIFKADLACDGVELTNIPRHIRWANEDEEERE